MPKHISLKQTRYYWPVYAFILPSLLLICTFSYYPALNGMYHSLYRWNGSTVEYYIGIQNFRDLLGWAPGLWCIEALWVALLAITLTGKPAWAKDKAPWAMCGLLAVMGLSVCLKMSQLAAPGALAGTVDVKFFGQPVADAARWLSVSIYCTFGGVLLHYFFNTNFTRILRGLLVTFGFLWFFDLTMQATGDYNLWYGFSVTFILVCANVVKMIPSIVTATVIHRLKSERMQYIYRVLFVIPMIIPGMVMLLIWKFFYDPNQGILNLILYKTGLMDVLVGLSNWLDLGVFQEGRPPAWLGDANLVLPAFIFWGFPWVGVVGVLLYLAGLSNISQDVYEAADLDGVNWFQKFTNIELPLILTQVRINMILLIIGTLQDYGNVLIVLGNTGGPKGVMNLPGLYMFYTAFVSGDAGKSCAIGMILFAFILLLTEINNRYVRVEK